MGLWDQSCDIEQLDRDEASASFTGGILRLAGTAELFVGASLPNEGHTSVRLDCRERIVCDLDRRESRRGEERGLTNIWFPDNPQLHEATNVMLPQVPLWIPSTDSFRGGWEGRLRFPCYAFVGGTKLGKPRFRRLLQAHPGQRIQESVT